MGEEEVEVRGVHGAAAVEIAGEALAGVVALREEEGEVDGVGVAVVVDAVSYSLVCLPSF